MKIYLTPYNLCKVILALNTLLTLLFNSDYILFGNYIQEIHTYGNYSIFYILSNHLCLAKLVSVIILIFAISGYFPIISSILQWYITFSFITVSDVTYGGDNISSNVLFLFIPYSFFQNKKNHFLNNTFSKKNVIKEEVKWFFYFAVLLQISLIYFHAFFEKLKIEEWKNGTAVFYYLTNNEYGLGNYPIVKDFLKNKLFLIKLMTWGTLIIECFISMLILIKHKLKTQILLNLLLISVLFHFFLMVCFGIFPFFLVMSGVLIFYVLPNNYKIEITLNY